MLFCCATALAPGRTKMLTESLPYPSQAVLVEGGGGKNGGIVLSREPLARVVQTGAINEVEKDNNLRQH